MKVALVHDWLTGMRGGEKCLEVFCEMFPSAHLYTLLHMKGSVSTTIEQMDLRVSALQKFPAAARQYRYYLPVMPWIVDTWNTGEEHYDLVLSSCHCVAKGIRFAHAHRRVCYCFTPMRYIWCQTENYYRGDWRQAALKLVKLPLRRWDLKSNRNVDEFIGISNHVSDRIRRFYGREATTIYPPVDDGFFQLPATGMKRKDVYLMVGALEPYKRVDLAVEAFRRSGRPLRVVGKGTLLERFRQTAPPNVEFLGWKSDEETRALYQEARGLIFPGEEDFGIVPLEAQACGCPVLAYGVGGALETVVENETGSFFREPTAESLAEALARFEKTQWNPARLRTHAERFGRTRFRREMEAYLAERR